MTQNLRSLNEPWGIHWFRRDLRVIGNKALRTNWKKTNGRTLGLFCFDSKFLSRSDFSHNRFAFFLNTLKELQSEMRQLGGELIVVDQLPAEFFAKLFTELRKKNAVLPSVISWGRDYEPFARKRDQEVSEILNRHGIESHTERDHLIFEPGEIKKDSDGEFYKVFTPFSRKWLETFHSEKGLSRIEEQKVNSTMLETLSQEKKIFSINWKDLGIASMHFSDQINSFEEKNGSQVTVPIPKGGFSKAYETLLGFDQKISNYKSDRDMPNIPGTSRLSIYFKNGSLTTSQVLYAIRNNFRPRNDEGTSTYIKEIIWREFYYHILFHCPNVESDAFLPQFRNIKWENREDFFECWMEGKTGFPIVDAGMRQLKQTGWMHNRVRMIVGSFLVKDLLIDWRWGENYFMKELLDGDLAPNNGGWQWVASTGCDPQPYFRIFNPWLQSQKFDPDGNYIRKYVPELAKAPTAAIHKPEADRTVWNYPRPIVEHDQQKKRALLLYKS